MHQVLLVGTDPSICDAMQRELDRLSIPCVVHRTIPDELPFGASDGYRAIVLCVTDTIPADLEWQRLVSDESPPLLIVAEHMLPAETTVELISRGIWVTSLAGRFPSVVARQIAQLVGNQVESAAPTPGEKTASAGSRPQPDVSDGLIDSIPLMVLCKDRDGRYTFANQTLCRQLGYSREQLIGMTDEDLFPPHLTKIYRAGDDRVMQTGQTLDEVEEFIGPDGQQRFVQVVKSPRYDSHGKVSGVQVAFWDITPARQSEAALRDTEQTRQAVFEAMLDCLIIADAEGRILAFNRAAEQTLGYTRNEVIGQDVNLLLFAPAGSDRPRSNLERYRTRNEKGSLLESHNEIPAIRKNGERFVAEIAIVPVPSHGQAGFGIFLRDVTDRIEAELKLQQYAKELERSNEDLKQFAYVASHDLQEPLRAVAGFCQLLKRRCSEKLNEEELSFLDHAVDGSKRMRKLIDDLLAYSRVHTGKRLAQATDLTEIVRETLDGLQTAIDEIGARVSVGPLPTLYVEPTLMKQLFHNLIGNALKFHSDRPPRIQITARQQHRECLIAVRDNGIGLDPQFRDRIFAMFQRLHTRDRYPGTGIGLAICKKIIETHGGRIWVDSRPNVGSSFFFTLPEADPLDPDEASFSRSTDGLAP